MELYDSGASRHMSPYRHLFLNFEPITPKSITAADKGTFTAIGRGDIKITVPNGTKSVEILLKKVLYAPKMGLTLVSISKIDDAGYAILFRNKKCKIFTLTKKLIGSIPVYRGVYLVTHRSATESATSAVETVTLDELHRRLGHIAPEAVKKMVKEGLIEGIRLDVSTELKGCTSCEYAKMHRKAVAKERVAESAKELGDEVYTDVWGPAPVQTIDGMSYFVTFTDGAKRHTHLYLLRKKDQAFDGYKDYEAWLKNQKGRSVKKLHSDRGGEFNSHEFDKHLARNGTARSLTTHDTPEHNGIAERLNRTLLEKVRAMLHASGLPKFLWGEAVKHAVWLKNRTTTRALQRQTPYEGVEGKKPNLTGVPEFGARVWVHDTTGTKLDARSQVGRWVGFDMTSSGHRIYWEHKRSIGVERSVKFDSTHVLDPPSAPFEGEEESTGVKRSTVAPKSSSTPPVPSLNDGTTNGSTWRQLRARRYIWRPRETCPKGVRVFGKDS
jgi:hypothetical protein